MTASWFLVVGVFVSHYQRGEGKRTDGTQTSEHQAEQHVTESPDSSRIPHEDHSPVFIAY